jgi:tripartite-type tricarboxylate transporter receptor subunit TctC
MMILRSGLLLAALTLAMISFAGTAADQKFPSKSIRFIVGFAPGGGNDLLARTVGQKVSEQVGQTVIVDNRPGAGGNLGAELASRALPDGYTILMISSSHPIQGLLKSGLKYDPMADFTPLALLATYSYLVVTPPSLEARTVKELIALAKSRPAQFNFVSAGNGSGSHLAGELFRIATGTELSHVAYKGTAQAITDLVGGRVQLMFSPMPAVIAQVKAGRLRVLAVTGSKRTPLMPEVPTVAESGVANFQVSPWYGVMGPARMPPVVSAALNRQFSEALKAPEVKDRLSSEGAEPAPTSREEFVRLVRAEYDKWNKVIKQTGIRAD